MISFVKIFSLICATIILSACQTGGANLKYKTIESVKFNPQETNRAYPLNAHTHNM